MMTAPTAGAYDLNLKAGRLGSYLGLIGKDNPTELKITGEMDVRDFSNLVSLPASVKTLDLSGVNVVAYTYTSGDYKGVSEFKAGDIPCYSFTGLDVTTIKLPSGATSLGEGALAATSATSVTLPAKLTEVGAYCFYDSPKLTAISLPATVKTLGKEAFGKCASLKTVNMKSSAVTELPEGCFEGCGRLVELTLPANLKVLGREALARTAVTKLDLSSVTNAEPFALAEMPALEEVMFNSKATLGKGLLFSDAKLAKIENPGAEIPEIMAAGDRALILDGSLQNVKSIGAYSFAGNGLTKIAFGADLATIGDGAFSDGGSISIIDALKCEENTPAVTGDPFSGVEKGDVQLLVTPASKDKWKAHPYWNQFNVVTEISTVSEVTDISKEINIRIADGRLKVTANIPLTDVEVYDIEGGVIKRAAPGTIEYESEIYPDHDVLIVRAVAGDCVKIAKIIR